MTQINIDGRDFKNAIAALKLKPVAPKRPTHELLGYAKVENNSITVTDLQNWISYQIDTNNISSTYLISIKDLVAIDKAVKAVKKVYPVVSIDFTAKTATVGNTVFKIDCKLDKDNDYPDAPDMTGESINELPTESLKDMVSSIGYAMSPDETKQILMGMHLTINNNGIESAAIDSHRMAVYNIRCDDVNPCEVTLDSTFLKAFAGIKTWSPLIKLVIDDEMSMITDGKITLIGRNLQGNYPMYRQLFPDLTQGNMVRYDKAELMSITKQILSDDKGALIKLWLHLNRVSDKTEHIETIVQSDLHGDIAQDKTLLFQAKYLSDLLSVVKENIVELRFNSVPFPPVVVLTTNCKHLIMPIQERG